MYESIYNSRRKAKSKRQIYAGNTNRFGRYWNPSIDFAIGCLTTRGNAMVPYAIKTPGRIK